MKLNSLTTGLFILLLQIFVSCQKEKPKNVKVASLTSEYLKNPIGLDTEKPRFRWKLETGDQEVLQENYEIYVGTDSVEVSNGKGNFWQSGELADGSNLAIYDGEPLKPFTKYYWSVRIGVENSKINAISEVASFETGIMNETWKGSWITDGEDMDLKPAPYFRKEIDITKEVKKATAYITAAGLFELHINGDKIGNNRLDPTYTRYDKRNLYVTHDVTKQIQEEDEIALGVILGNGWYNHQSTAVWNFHEAGWRNRPRFLMNLKIQYKDGTSEDIVTDSDWKTATGPIIFNSIYTAEHYNANLEDSNWNSPNFEGSAWENAIETEAPSNNIVAQSLHPVRSTEEIKPVSVQKISDTKYIFDLGRNISGVSKIKLKGEPNTELRITHAEQLDSTGAIDMSNIDVHYRPTDDSDPFQTDIFTLKGDGEETFMPKFNYKGFQYVEVKSNKPVELNKESLTGMFMHSDVPQVGKIKSSNEIINKIWEATNASYLSNLFGYPTDCPQREKNGWTGDAHIAIETGLYNYDGITVYEKWMDDHRDEQQPNGVLPSIIPTWGWGYDWGNGPDWTSTIAIIPWELYQFYGDSRALEENYDNIKLYVDHITEISPSGLTDWGLGDWVPVEDKTPVELTSSIYYYVDANILAKTAKLLGKEEDNRKYSDLAEKIKLAINEKYLNKETGIYGSGFQTELSAPLYWGIVPTNQKELVAKNLAAKVIEDEKHINVGLLGSKTILNALSENGYEDLAYEVASRETYPSWGWWIKNGATTLLENWDIGADSDLSRNHIMFGEVSAWFFKALGGIFPDHENPGFKNVILKPNFVDDLENFEARHDGPYGEIISKWEKQEENVVKYEVSIPPNSTATVHLKAKNMQLNGKDVESGEKARFNLKSGKHEILISLQ
ncbi:alpha-rhamnosidase [Salegentibacter salinarum]|uniref:alpha-L-rhamnosidase n=1 Tax=Salegentibacter salinarum TaxID=447422 RepID=A0A2N0U055_9FLAO|nr:alpha-L-rhamnosidase [Salegentibacter salinarum]PKD20382.1 alpha-rhamnosidase [Salegentibacter salinarum]SKB85385.1 alpha-L-rhamnosidase [Salegentibacter salinarum]